METFVTIMMSTFVVMIFAEFGDKTNLIALSLMTKSQRPYFVALFSTIGIGLSTILSVVIGAFLGDILPLDLIRYATAVVFVFLGIWTLYGQEEEEGELDEEDREKTEISWYQPIYLVALAEFGDKSQIFVITASASTLPVAIFLGSTLGMAVIMFGTAVFGSIFIEKVDAEVLEKIAGLLFIIAGLWIGISTLVT